MPLRWKKKFGQHLLHDHNILRKIVTALKLSPGECVIEIGSGSGALTEFLAAEPVSLIAVELDPQFYDILQQKFGDLSNVELVSGDILKIDIRGLVPENSRAVITGNLPYNITSRILFYLFDCRDVISRMIFTVQKEIAQRIVAPVNSKERGILSVICRFHADPIILFPVSRNCFFPKPQVDSAVLALNMKPVPDDVSFYKMQQLVKTCFGKRRKTLRNSLSLLAGLPRVRLLELESEFDLSRRPEELEVSEFIDLTRAVYAHESTVK